MRLDKFICESVGLSRTQAKKIIAQGEVSVDGVSAKNSASKVTTANKVRYLGRSLSVQSLRYIMLNKPLGTVCTSLDDDARSVLALLNVNNSADLHCAGRLDIDTSGLVLLTDDGVWSHKITSPKKQRGKRYRVKLAEPLVEGAINQFAEGIQLKNEVGLTRPAQLEFLAPDEVLLTIHEGKYHQVKRMFGALNNRVVGLHREQVGTIQLDESLAPGAWRFLTQAEVDSIV